MEDQEIIDNLKKIMKSIDEVLICIKNDEIIIEQMREIIEKSTDVIEIFSYETKLRVHITQIDGFRKELREFNETIQNITGNYNAYKFMECYTHAGDTIYDFNGCNLRTEKKKTSMWDKFLSYL